MSRNRHRKPALLTHHQVAAMIAAAVAVERERHDRMLGAVASAVGETFEVLEQAGDAIVDLAQQLDAHAGLLRPMADVLASGLGLTEAAETATDPN